MSFGTPVTCPKVISCWCGVISCWFGVSGKVSDLLCLVVVNLLLVLQLSIFSKPDSIRSRVVFPQPDGPSKAVILPLSISKEKFLKTSNSPKLFVMFLI